VAGSHRLPDSPDMIARHLKGWMMLWNGPDCQGNHGLTPFLNKRHEYKKNPDQQGAR